MLGIQESVFLMVVMNSLSVVKVLKSWSQITLPITSMVTLVVSSSSLNTRFAEACSSRILTRISAHSTMLTMNALVFAFGFALDTLTLAPD
jgi:hypothetical protein